MRNLSKFAKNKVRMTCKLVIFHDLYQVSISLSVRVVNRGELRGMEYSERKGVGKGGKP